MQEGKDAKEGKKHNAYGASWLCPVQERIESRAAQVVLEKKIDFRQWFLTKVINYETMTLYELWIHATPFSELSFTNQQLVISRRLHPLPPDWSNGTVLTCAWLVSNKYDRDNLMLYNFFIMLEKLCHGLGSRPKLMDMSRTCHAAADGIL